MFAVKSFSTATSLVNIILCFLTGTRYTKTLLETGSSPEQFLDEFRAYEKDLQGIYDSLPTELLFSPRGFQVRAYSPTRINFIALHMYWHHCHCELYRVLNPGYREALPLEVIQMTSPEFVAYAQSNCLKHAIAIGDMISSTYNLVDGVYVSDYALGVNLYQASCAILYACHRDSTSYSMDTERARGYFNAFIETLRRFTQYFPRFNIYLEDIRNMLRSIDDPNAALPRQEHPRDASGTVREVNYTIRYVSEENPEEIVADRPTHADLTGAATVVADARLLHDTAADIDHQVSMGMSTATTMNIASEGILEHAFQSTDPMSLEGQDMLWPYGDVNANSTDFFADFGLDPCQTVLWDWAGALPTFT